MASTCLSTLDPSGSSCAAEAAALLIVEGGREIPASPRKRRRVGGGDVTGGGGDDGGVRVRSAEGEVVAWSRSAAARSAALANWVSDTGGAEGAFATLVPAAALRTLSRVAEGGAEEGGALEGCSLAQLAQLLHGAHFLDVDVELLRLLSRSLCTGHLAGKSGPELGRLLGVVSDFPTEAERQAATEEPLYTQDAQHDATAPRAADAPTPPAPVCWLSTQLVNEDALEDALADADVPTLRALKGVSLAWRARARRVLCARLCARVGLPLTSNLVKVTKLDLSDSRAAGRLFADAADALRWLPNLAKVTGLGGFEVDVAGLRRVARRVASSSGSEEYFDGPPPYPMAGVRACIRGEGEVPMEVLLAACVLRDGKAHVPAGAFRDDTSMTSIALPAGLTSIGESAFEGCSSLASSALPAGLTIICEFAFYGCSSMTSIALPAGLTSIGESAFINCSSLTSIALPASLTSIDGSAFAVCSSMTSIELPAGLTRLGQDAFYGCSSMASIALPAGLTSIGEYAFHGCSSLTSIELPAGLTSLGERAFEGCSSLVSIELPAGLTSLGRSTFASCSSMTLIKLPAGLTSIGEGAFKGCSSLVSIELPAGLTSLGRTSEQMRRLMQLRKAVCNARRPRACDENYKESAIWKYSAKNNAKNNAKRLKAGDEGYRESALAKYNAERLKAGEEGYDESSRGKTGAALEAQRLQRDLDGRARRARLLGEAEVQMEDLVEEVENAATKIMPFIQSFLASGHGVNILTASEHRTKPNVINGGGSLLTSITELPSTGVLPEPVELTGLPDGGHARDEAKRWLCFDNNPSFQDKETGESLHHTKFDSTFKVFAVSKSIFNEHTRLLEGELQRRFCGTDNSQFWPLYMNTHPGNLDGPHSMDYTYVLLAVTKLPLAASPLTRRKPEWAGLQSGASIQTLCNKIRLGVKNATEGPYDHPQVASIKERIAFQDLPYEVALIAERRLVIDASLGHKHKHRANANCFYKIQLWADGKVTAAYGRLEQESKGGLYQIVAMDLQPEQALKVFEMDTKKQEKKGYVQQL